ncbi:MAG: PEGA domain-containing protein [Myxococcales bacterium]|nr:PEGA domain-containing protein [Myxococcales bacterium]MCB9546183.1 PEGA domain-containing protein [Myxococcales bacterium]
MRLLLALLLLLLVPMAVTAQDAGVDDDDEAAADAGTTKAAVQHVKLTFTSSPSGAEVWYGKKLLGTTPVNVTRRKDSGPVDVVFKLGGYLKVNSRGYTWADDKIHAKMTPVDKANTLLGFKKPLETSPDEEGADLDEDDAR